MQRQQDGFGRVFQLTRPNSATVVKVPYSPTTFEVTYGNARNELDKSEKAQARPSTAGLLRNDSFKQFRNDFESRPNTAAAGSSRFSTLQFPTNGRVEEEVRVPRFVEFDKKICRFHAHFFQDRNWEKDCPLGDPVIETRIPRLLTVLYHLVDDSIEITEPKQTNSGFFFVFCFLNSFYFLQNKKKIIHNSLLVPMYNCKNNINNKRYFGRYIFSSRQACERVK
jgi:hypothetical protein